MVDNGVERLRLVLERIELEGTNIGTSCFCPGGVNTDNLPEGTRPPRVGRDGKPLPNFGAALMDPLEAGERC